jgi:hypothetical protein
MNTKHHADLDELITKVLADYQRPEDLVGTTGLLAQLTQRLIERAMDVERAIVIHGSPGLPSTPINDGKKEMIAAIHPAFDTARDCWP